MGTVWKRSRPAKVRLEFGRKLPFSADRYSFRPTGFNAKGGLCIQASEGKGFPKASQFYGKPGKASEDR